MTPTATQRPPVSEGYLSKTEASKKFNRHEATLTKDVIAALRADDQEILALLKVQTKDGTEYSGIDIAKDKGKMTALNKQGLQAWWYFHPTDVVPLFIKRKSSGVSTKKSSVGVHRRHSEEEGTALRQPPRGPDEVPTSVAVELAELKRDVYHLKEKTVTQASTIDELKAEKKELTGILRKQANSLSTYGFKMIQDKQTIDDLNRQLLEGGTNFKLSSDPNKPTVLNATASPTKSTKPSYWDRHAPWVSPTRFKVPKNLIAALLVSLFAYVLSFLPFPWT